MANWTRWIRRQQMAGEGVAVEEEEDLAYRRANRRSCRHGQASSGATAQGGDDIEHRLPPDGMGDNAE